jgi:hypothetical protein
MGMRSESGGRPGPGAVRLGVSSPWPGNDCCSPAQRPCARSSRRVTGWSGQSAALVATQATPANALAYVAGIRGAGARSQWQNRNLVKCPRSLNTASVRAGCIKLETSSRALADVCFPWPSGGASRPLPSGHLVAANPPRLAPRTLPWIQAQATASISGNGGCARQLSCSQAASSVGASSWG